MSSTPPGKKQTKEDGPRSKLESEAPGTQHVGKVECMRSNRSIRLQSQSEHGKEEGNTWVRDRKPSQDTGISLRGVSWSEVNTTALRVQPGCPPRLTLAVVHIPCLVVTPPVRRVVQLYCGVGRGERDSFPYTRYKPPHTGSWVWSAQTGSRRPSP